LRGLGAATQEQHDSITLETKIHAITGTIKNPQLINSVPHGCVIA
jgi:hypothetical protein